MLDKLFSGSRLHEHADPAQRVLGAAALPPDAPALAQLMRADASADVRAAAAARCSDAAALAAALATETDEKVKSVIAASLGRAVAAADAATVSTLLAAPACSDAVRAQAALHAASEEQRLGALATIEDENLLVDVALGADHAAVRIAAAERVQAAGPLGRLFDGARDRDRGVARLARRRLDAITERNDSAAAADALLAEAEALVSQPGPVVMAAVELDRRWKALALGDDAPRRERWDEVGRRLQQRFDSENAEQRRHVQLDQRISEWLAGLGTPPASSALPALRAELEALRAEAGGSHDAAALARLTPADAQIAQWEQAAPALAAAEALVIEAEQLADGTPIDNAELPARWQTLDLAARTPALSRRFEAALLIIEQRRLATVRAAQQEQGAARQLLHAALHTAEQALAAGQLADARAAVDQTRALKLRAGVLPKPSVQRLSRVVQQLTELERWQQFGQASARMQLCERAEALVQQALAPVQAANDVKALRAEWKKLDEQHAGVPKSLWERFNAACEKAYAPAARHFAEQAALHKQVRRQREEFITAAAAHAPTLLAEPHDWRAIEHWLRDTGAKWRSGELGSVEPGMWKKLDARLKAAVAPAHDALAAARHAARQERETLITAAQELAAKAAERDTPSQVKELQARWQANAKSIALLQRDERALWDRFRAACNAVFDARTESRKEAEQQRRESEQQRRAQRRPAEAHAATVRATVDEPPRAKSRPAETAGLRALFERERLCAELDAIVLADTANADAAAAAAVIAERWPALSPVAADWDKRMAARRDAALHALTDDDARYDCADLIEANRAARRDVLLEIELTLGIASPPDLQKERLAVQVRQLRDRFKRTAPGDPGGAVQLLLQWCELSGVAETRDSQRCETIIARLDRTPVSR